MPASHSSARVAATDCREPPAITAHEAASLSTMPPPIAARASVAQCWGVADCHQKREPIMSVEQRVGLGVDLRLSGGGFGPSTLEAKHQRTGRATVA